MNFYSDKAIIETDNIGANVVVNEYSIIRKNVALGDNVVIHPFVIIESGVKIGDNVEIFSGSVIGKYPKGAGTSLRKLDYKEFVYIGDNCCIGPNAVIYYEVSIGNNTLIGDGTSISEKCLIGSFSLVARNCTIAYGVTIGNNTKIMNQTNITGKSIIGNNVFISCQVATSNDNNFGKAGYNDLVMNIEDEVKIGAGANLLPGIRVGKGATVGASALVTKNVPNNSVVFGIPAKVVKYNNTNL